MIEHYGIDDESLRGAKENEGATDEEHLLRVELPPHRGGLATMGLFLTKSSLPLRTSPVQRGVWLMESLLGRQLPNPPANVPSLSEDAVDESGLTIREQLERHRADSSCASCHDKIDPLGISLEGFDPIGRFALPWLESAAWAAGELSDKPPVRFGTMLFANGVNPYEWSATSDDRLEGWRPTLDEPNLDRPPETLPQDVSDHMRMMVDLILLAWRMDKTRVATLIFNRDVSHMKFGFLDGVLNDQLHGISHHKDNPKKLASYQRINEFHVEQFAYLLKQMKEIDEGGGTTLLDNVMLLFGSNMFNGDSHDGRSLPLVLAGHGGGAIAGGRVLDFGDQPEEEQRACNLYTVLAQTMGVRLDRFGDSVGRVN